MNSDIIKQSKSTPILELVPKKDRIREINHIRWTIVYQLLRIAVKEMEKGRESVSAEALFYLGCACEQLGDVQRALDAFFRAWAMDPTCKLSASLCI